MRRTLAEAVEQNREGLRIRGPAERERAGHRGHGAGADGDQQGVVARLDTARRACNPAPRIDRAEAAEREKGAALVSDRAQVEPVDVAEPEWLSGRKRPVPELGLGREELDHHPLLRELLQREQGLEAGHAAARDQDVQRAAARGGGLHR